MYRNIDA